MPDTMEGEEYGSYDPEEIVLLPEDDEETPEPVEGVAEPELDPVLFDPRYVEPFKGLLYLGALTKQFEWLGHKFVIRTLTTDELLAVPMLIKQWEDTIGHARAYSTAMVALATMSVDDEALPTPVQSASTDYAWAFQKFNFVKGRWFVYTIDKVYSEYLELEKTAGEVIEAMGNASG
jgi:hypothetical protein